MFNVSEIYNYSLFNVFIVMIVLPLKIYACVHADMDVLQVGAV